MAKNLRWKASGSGRLGAWRFSDGRVLVGLTSPHARSYWAKHLQGRPYHISALYVVDLDRFRQIAAGDLLRQQYQALSADPGSLANLDQDLPNNMTPNLPIVSGFPCAEETSRC